MVFGMRIRRATKAPEADEAEVDEQPPTELSDSLFVSQSAPAPEVEPEPVPEAEPGPAPAAPPGCPPRAARVVRRGGVAPRGHGGVAGEEGRGPPAPPILRSTGVGS